MFGELVLDYMPCKPKKEREMYAKEFGEGLEELTELLMLLWDNDINTVACCKGHSVNDSPYITLDFSNLTSKQISYITTQIIRQLDINKKSLHEIEYTCDKIKNLDERKTLTIYFIDTPSADFSSLLMIFKNALSPNINLFKPSYDDMPQDTEDFVMSAINMKELNIENYMKTTDKPPIETFTRIDISYSGLTTKHPGMFNIRTLDNLKRQLCRCMLSNGIHYICAVAEGYATVTPTNEYVTVKNHKLVQISKDEADKLGYLEEKSKCKFDCEYSKEIFDKVYKEIFDKQLLKLF